MKKIYIIILGLITLIGIALYAVFLSREKPIVDVSYTVEKTETPNAYELAKKTEAKKAQEYASTYNTAIKTKNHTTCAAIENAEKQQECHDTIDAGLIRIEKNQEKCKTLKTESLQTLCQDVIIYDIALGGVDSSLCETISDTVRRESCREEIEGIVFGKRLRENQLDRTYCNTLSEKYRQDCLREVVIQGDQEILKKAIQNTDLRLCENIHDTEVRTRCIETLSYRQAQSEDNPDLCMNITDTSKKEFCKQQSKKNNDTGLYRESIESGSIENCEKIEKQTLRDKCHDTLIMTRVHTEKNIDLCDLLRNTPMIATCKKTVL